MGTKNQNSIKESNTTESGANLTPREKEVVDLAADGLTDKEIAAELQLSTHTVATYWRRLRTRFNLPTRTAVVVRVLRQQTKQAQAQYEEELVARQRAESALSEALDQANNNLSSTASNLGERIQNEFKMKSQLEQHRRAIEESNQLLTGARCFVYSAETQEPYNALSISHSCAVFGLDASKVLSRETPFYELMDHEDLGRIVADFPESDRSFRGRFAFLYRLRGKAERRYALDVTQIHFSEQGQPMHYGGVVIDVQDLVDLGVIDPSKGVKFRLPPIQT